MADDKLDKAIKTLRNPAPGVTLVSHGWVKAPAMADDTVEAAKAVLEEAIQRSITAVRCDGAYPDIIPTAHIDALIAAVRAEQEAEPLHHSLLLLAQLRATVLAMRDREPERHHSQRLIAVEMCAAIVREIDQLAVELSHGLR